MSFRLTPHRFFSTNPVGTDWVSGHIGTDRVIRKANQVWIDTLARTGQVPLMPVSQILAWVNEEARHE